MTLKLKHRQGMPDLTDWGIGAMNEALRAIDKGMRKALAESIRLAFEDEQTYVSFPVKRAADPLTIYLQIAISTDDRDFPTYEFSLRDALAETITNADDETYAPGLGRLSVALRELADEVDQARTALGSTPGKTS